MVLQRHRARELDSELGEHLGATRNSPEAMMRFGEARVGLSMGTRSSGKEVDAEGLPETKGKADEVGNDFG